MRYIPIYICDKRILNQIRNARVFQRLYLFFLGSYGGIIAFTSIPSRLGLEVVYQGSFGLIVLMNLFIYRRSNANCQTCCLNIEWDIDEEQFVVKMPKGPFGGVKELRIYPSNFE